MKSASGFYQQKIKDFSSGLQSVSQKLKWFGWYRFFSFVFIFVPLFAFKVGIILSLSLSLFATILFFFLVRKNIQLEKQKSKITVLKKLAEDENLALKHSFSHFKTGAEFLDVNHNYSYDLDLFGEGSLFQFINRTVTKSGERKLAEWLMNPFISKTEIRQKQEAIKELSKIPEWRLNFLAEGRLFEETNGMNDEIKAWSDMELQLSNAEKIKWLIRIFPVVTILSIVRSVMGFTDLFLFLFVLSQWILVFVFFWKKINEFFRFFGRKSQLLGKYMQLLQQIESCDFQSDYLVGLKENILFPESAGSTFGKLKTLVKEFEYRVNMLVGFILNSILLWDIRCIYLLWKWHNENHQKLTVWLDSIAEMDALISLGNFAYNHPSYIYPVISDEDFTFNSVDLGHPLLHPEKRIVNDFEINGWSKAIIVTGANMAGKSTFLRTVGVNLILGRIGAPVCATKMNFTPVKIYTNMRTTDSLLKDESYFFAELKRIKGVLERLKKGERIFIILDEMLKGTNSIDKLNGSKKLIRKLIEFESISLIATHDLKLGEMEEEFPNHVFNYCFEIRIDNDELVFDYRLSKGVTKTMNATFLMKKMGII